MSPEVRYPPRVVGQFFTPESVVRCMFSLADVREGGRAIDPSSGDGSFLLWAPEELDLHACEVDPQYASRSGSLVRQGRFIAGDALRSLREWWGIFDLVIGNPPFSSQADLVKDPGVLSDFELGAGRKSQCLEVLFLELFCKLARPGGRIAVVLPDGPFGNRPLHYVRKWLLQKARVEAIISLPRETFSKTAAKTNILIATIVEPEPDRDLVATALLKCDHLDELQHLIPGGWMNASSRWNHVVLAASSDWRPEAHARPCAREPGESVRLGDLGVLRTGFAKYGEARRLDDLPGPDHILLIRAKNLAPDGGLRLDDNLAYIKRDGPMFKDRALVYPGEILFVRVGVGCYGRAALVPAGTVAQADDWIHVLTPHAGVDAHGIVDWLNSDHGRTAVKALAKGVGTLSISKSSLAELQVPAGLGR